MTARSALVAALWWGSLSSLAQPPAREKVVVMDLQAGEDVTPEAAAALTEAVAATAGGSGHFTVISSRELQALLGMERQRQLMGCSESACMSEIGSALGARYLLRGTVGRLGASFQLALQLVDTNRAETVSRSNRLAPTVEALRDRLPYAVAIAIGVPPPPPPSRLPAFAALGGGGALVITGAVIGGFGLIEDNALAREQALGVPGTVGTRASYADARTRLGLQKSGGLAAVILGAGLIGLGVYLWPPDLSSDAFALRVGPGSISIAGVFP